MRYALPAIVAAAAVNAQGVTDYLAPKDPAPSGCQLNYDGQFAIHAQPIIKNDKRELSTSSTTSTTFTTSTIPGSVKTVTTHTKPTLTSTETDVVTSYTTITPLVTSVVPISQISDGQVQDPPVSSIVPITQIGDGQLQDPVMMTVTGTTTMLSTITMASSMVSQIGDGQPQAPASTGLVTSVSTMVSTYTSTMPMPAITQSFYTTSSLDYTSSTIQPWPETTGKSSVIPVSQIGDGQAQAPTSALSKRKVFTRKPPPHWRTIPGGWRGQNIASVTKRAEPTSSSDDDEYYYEETTEDLVERQSGECIKWRKKCHRLRNFCDKECIRWSKDKREVYAIPVNGLNSTGEGRMLYIEPLGKKDFFFSEQDSNGLWHNKTVHLGWHKKQALKAAGLKNLIFGSWDKAKRSMGDEASYKATVAAMLVIYAELIMIDPSSLGKRDGPSKFGSCASSTEFKMTLNNGTLLDGQGRIGSIVNNRQFQFDGPPAQNGAIFTGGWSVCGDGSLALGGSTTFFRCQSGTFFNLYDQAIAPYCEPVTLQVMDLKDC